MAIAAMLIVAISVGFMLRHVMLPPVSPTPTTLAIGKAGSHWQIRQGLVEWLEEDNRLSVEVWRTTGREIASLPQQVRRAAAFSESAQMTGAIRPMAAAWQALWRVFPGDPTNPEPSSGETSLFALETQEVWV